MNHEQNDSSTKRAIPVNTLRYNKRLRTKEGSLRDYRVFGKKVIDIDSDDEDDKSEDLSGEDTSTDLPNEHSQQKHAIDNDATRPVEHRVKQPKIPPTYLVITDKYVPGALMSIDSLPMHVRAELERRLNDMWSAHNQTIIEYTACIQNLKRHAFKRLCMHENLVQCSLSDDSITRRVKESSTYACKECTAAGCPCARLICRGQEDGAVIHWVPLRPGLRKGIFRHELGHWVLPEVDTEMTLAR